MNHTGSNSNSCQGGGEGRGAVCFETLEHLLLGALTGQFLSKVFANSIFIFTHISFFVASPPRVQFYFTLHAFLKFSGY